VAKLCCQQIGEQVVNAEPLSLAIEGNHESARFRKRSQMALGTEFPRQEVAERTVDAVENGGVDEQPSDVGGQAAQHFGHEILGHRSLTSRKLEDKSLRVRVCRHGDRCQAQSGYPSLGPIMKQLHSVVRENNPDSGEQLL